MCFNLKVNPLIVIVQVILVFMYDDVVVSMHVYILISGIVVETTNWTSIQMRKALRHVDLVPSVSGYVLK